MIQCWEIIRDLDPDERSTTDRQNFRSISNRHNPVTLFGLNFMSKSLFWTIRPIKYTLGISKTLVRLEQVISNIAIAFVFFLSFRRCNIKWLGYQCLERFKTKQCWKSMHDLEFERAVGKIMKLESFKFERSFQLNDLSCINKNLERTFQHKTFQLNYLSNCSFQLYECPMLHGPCNITYNI